MIYSTTLCPPDPIESVSDCLTGLYSLLWSDSAETWHLSPAIWDFSGIGLWNFSGANLSDNAVPLSSYCSSDVLYSGVWQKQEEAWENIELFWNDWSINLAGEYCG